MASTQHRNPPPDTPSLDIVHSPEQERYEAFLPADGGRVFVGYLDYVSEHDQFHARDQIAVTHTVIDPQHSGKGYAAQLVTYVLDDLRAQHRTIIPLCSYVAQFVQQHPDYADMVDPTGGTV